jgi:hypothetical protein
MQMRVAHAPHYKTRKRKSFSSVKCTSRSRAAARVVVSRLCTR